MLSIEEVEEILKTISLEVKKHDDSFFNDANTALFSKYKKLGVITTNDYDADSGNDDHSTGEANTTKIHCNAFGCQQVFQNVATYQSHFNSVHRFICAQCKRSMPTAHLLDLHISEHHDAYFAARVDRGDLVYACLLEECKIMFKCPEERKEHCIKTHKFPGNYRFFQANKTENKSHKKAQQERNFNENSMDMPMEIVTNKNKIESMEKSKPFSFTFGHQTEKTFLLKYNNKKHCKDSPHDTLDDMQDLRMALDDVKATT